MVDNEMYLQLKLTSQKPRIVIFSIIGISIIVLVLSIGQLNTCGIQHVSLVENIKTFENNQDSEFCAETVRKILEYNEQCEPYIEILDCG